MTTERTEDLTDYYRNITTGKGVEAFHTEPVFPARASSNFPQDMNSCCVLENDMANI